MSTETPIKQSVVTIWVSGNSYVVVGATGVTKIEQITKSGIYGDIPYLVVWKDTRAVAEFCQHNVIGVYFDDKKSTPPIEAEQKSAVLNKAAADVIAERKRQIDGEGCTTNHDDTYEDNELGYAAAFYATNGNSENLWPFAKEHQKIKDRRQNMVRAGALILAEIERLDRSDAAEISRFMSGTK